MLLQQRRIAKVCLRLVSLSIVVLLCFSSQRPTSADPGLDSQSRTHLIGLARLWAAVRFSHPAVFEGHVNWDDALTRALGDHDNVRTDEKFKETVSALLATLNDAQTRIDTSETVGAELPESHSQDGITVLSIHSYPTQKNATAYRAALSRAMTAGAQGNRILVDLRQIVAPSFRQADDLDDDFANAAFVETLTSQPIPPLNLRRRFYEGWPRPQGDSRAYHTGFESTTEPVGKPAKGAHDALVAFVVNGNSILPTDATALIAAGRAVAFAPANAPDVTITHSEKVALTPSLSVNVRVSEVVASDGGAGVPTRVGGFREAMRYLQSPDPEAARPAAASRPAAEPYYGNDSSLPDLPHRILAAFREWSTVQYFYPYRDLMHDDWDRAFTDSIATLEKTTTQFDYEAAIARLHAHIQDFHGNFPNGEAITQELRGHLPFSIEPIEGKATIVAVDALASAKAGYRIGDVIEAVDGVPIEQRKARLRPYVNAATPQAIDFCLDGFGPFSATSGPVGSVAAVTLRSGNGKMRVYNLTRQRDYGLAKSLYDTISVLPGDIGYVNLQDLSVARVDEMFSKLANTRGIILDLRGYPQAIFAVAPRLTALDHPLSALFSRPLVRGPQFHDQYGYAMSSWANFGQTLFDANGPRYLKPTVTLINETAVSAAENGGLFLEAAHTRFVGTPTMGTNGDVTSYDLPGGMTLTFSGQAVRHADGRQLQHVGLIPDIVAKPTIAGIRNGDDEILVAGLRALKVSGQDITSFKAFRRQIFLRALQAKAPAVP